MQANMQPHIVRERLQMRLKTYFITTSRARISTQ